jgi:glycosyltransferase involved in cell wall biosynthesis
LNPYPKISIIVPSFNQGQFIEDTILSIINQDYKQVEIIIIDGGSTDNSVELIKKYESHLNYWVSEKDSGQSEAINKGFEKASGDIITWLNSDDCYEPNALQKVAAAFSSDKDLALLHGKTLLFGANINTKTIGVDEDLKIQDYLPYMRFPQPSSFFSKIALQKIMPVNNHLHYAMDFELVVKLLLLGFKTKQTPERFSRYRMHANSKSNNDRAFIEDWSAVFINVLRSLPNGSNFIKELQELAIHSSDETSAYTSLVQLSTPQIQSAFLQHINLHFHYHYKHFHYNECKRISDFLKTRYTEFYIENQYKKFMFRLKFVPKFIFSLRRKLNA